MFTGRAQGPSHPRCAVPLGWPSGLLPCVCVDLGGPLLLRCCEGFAGQTGTGQQRSGPSFVTSKLPVLLAVSGKLLLLCSLCVSALCSLPLSLASLVLTCSPALAFTSCLPLPLVPLSFLSPLHSISFCHCCFPNPLSFVGGSFPSFSRRPAPRHCS